MKKFIFFCLVVSIFILALPVFAQEEEESTEGAQSIREAIRKNVEEKLAVLSKNPKAVTGVLKEITDTTLSLTTKNGEMLVAVSEDTKYFRVTNGKQATIKFAELAIDDFTVAMGYKNGEKVLDAKRVISYDVNPLPVHSAFYGTVRTNTDGDLTIQLSAQDSIWTIQSDTNTEVTTKGATAFEKAEIGEVMAGDKVIVVGSLNAKKSNTLLASKIHLVSGVRSQKATEKVTPTTTKKVSPTPSSRISPPTSVDR